MLALRRLVTQRQIWICSVVGAAAHNLGQMVAAILITRTPALLCYLPVLMISGIISGTFTSLCSQLVINRRNIPIRTK